MTTFSQAEIERLISCPKEIVEPPKREMKLFGAHFRKDAKLIAVDRVLTGEFVLFIRKSEDFPENFSIGLIYHPNDLRGEITLIRCNGKHGNFNRSLNPSHPHFDFHVHKAQESAIQDGKAPETVATKTAEYASFEQALQFFISLVNVRAADAQRHFPATLSFEQ